MKRQPFHHRFQDMDALPRRSFTSGKKWDPNHWFFEFHVSHEKKNSDTFHCLFDRDPYNIVNQNPHITG